LKQVAIGLMVMLIPCSANAGMLSAIRSSGWETKQTTHYKLDVMNYDARVYEWTPNENPNIRCVFVAGSENSTGVACYPVVDKSKK